MRLVLLGDLHFYQLGVWPWQLLSKRLLGQMNLWLNRRRHFRPALWPSVAARVVELAPDGLLGSGDFTTTALLGEFHEARARWNDLVGQLTLPAGAHVVPGNHDRYCFSSARKRLFEWAFEPWTAGTWPAVWRLSDAVYVVGLDPTRPNVWNASGALGGEQLNALGAALAEIPAAATVFVLCHYPIGTPPELPEEAAGHGLEDAGELTEVLAASDRPLMYLHGHIHWPWVWRPPGAPRVTVVNAGAPMLTGRRYPQGQGFVELTVGEEGVSICRHLMDAEGEWRRSDESSFDRANADCP